MPDDARQRLIEGNLPLAKALAYRYRHCGVEHDDLLQEVSLGLNEAARSWVDGATPEGFFFAYARPFCIKRIASAIAGAGPVRIPATLRRCIAQCKRARTSLMASGNPKPSVEDIAANTRYEILDCELALAFPASATRARLCDQLAEPSIDDHLERATQELWSAMEVLAEEDREILIMRYGLEPDQDALGLFELSRETLLSVSELKRRLDSIRGRLKLELERRGFRSLVPRVSDSVTAHAS